MVCEFCKSKVFGIGPLTPEELNKRTSGPWSYRRDIKSFMLSVDDGCYICNTLWNVLDVEERSLMLEVCDHRNQPCKFSYADCDQLCIKVSFVGIQRSKACGLSYIIPRLRRPASIRFEVSGALEASGPTCELAPMTDSPKSFSQANEWIADCDGRYGHESCKVDRDRSDTWLPTRLIDCDPSREFGSCRLIETSVTPVDGFYMTLSHCWGKTDCLKLTTDNYSQLLTNIDTSTLPQLYRDAIHAVRSLNIRYLWIDSICIIQKGDEFKDWQREVTRMCDVYSRSFCNIVAAAAPDSEHSMFVTRDLYSRDWKKDIKDAHINTRGWVLQERLLSPRNLYFGENQLVWECYHKTASEACPAGERNLLPQVTDGIKSKYARIKKCRSGYDIYVALGVWKEVVSEFTSCNLSFPSDKLPAISSIARRIADAIDDEYVVGMWRQTLATDLLWYVYSLPALPRPKEHRAPSWSWAAVDGYIRGTKPSDFEDDTLIRIEKVEIEYVNENDNTQQVKGGYLKLRGRLRRLRLTVKGAAHKNEWSFPLEDWINDTWASWEMVYLDSLHDNFDQEQSEGSLYFMPVSKIENDPEGKRVLNLLLLWCDPKEEGIFCRIGIAYLILQKETADRMLGPTEEEKGFPCDKYEDGYHFITIK